MLSSYKQVYPTSSCIAPCLNLHTMSRVARIAAYMVVSLLLVSDRSYTSSRALDQCFEPPRRMQRLNLPSSTSTRYCEKHRTTPLPHQTGQNTFKLVGTGHRRSSNIPHSTEHPKRRPQYFEARLRQRIEVLVVMLTGIETRAGSRVRVSRVRVRAIKISPVTFPYLFGRVTGL